MGRSIALGAAGLPGTRGGVPQGEKGAKQGELCPETPGVQGWLTPEKQGSAGAEFSPQASLKYIIGVLGKLSGPDLGKDLLESRKEIRRRARENFPPLQEFLDWQAKGTEKGRRPEKLTRRRFLPGVQPQDPPSNRKKFLRNPMGNHCFCANVRTYLLNRESYEIFRMLTCPSASDKTGGIGSRRGP
jgi:hypothetical protein